MKVQFSIIIDEPAEKIDPPLPVALELINLIPNSYIESVLDKDINDERQRDKNKMLMLLKK